MLLEEGTVMGRKAGTLDVGRKVLLGMPAVCYGLEAGAIRVIPGSLKKTTRN